jgi:DNA-binding LacI/PurR family transcriptional regulator
MADIPTTKEIARRLNISQSTVSRALNDHPRIGLRTKSRVMELARELNYEPNAKAISFKQKKTSVIGVVIPFIGEEFFSEAISGVETVALEHNYTILFGQSFDDLEREKKVVESMKKQRVDGLLISLSKQTLNYDHLCTLEKYNIPVLYFDRVPASDKVNKVYCDIEKATVEMISWLLDRGYKRIGFINGPSPLTASRERLKGYIEGISRRKMKVDMQLVEQTDFSPASTDSAMMNLLALKNPPTAIITFNEYVHMDAVKFAQQQKIQVNKDVLFLSYGNLSITTHTAFPPIASVEQYPALQGKRAAEILIDLIRRPASLISSPFFNEETTTKFVVHDDSE